MWGVCVCVCVTDGLSLLSTCVWYGGFCMFLVEMASWAFFCLSYSEVRGKMFLFVFESNDVVL